MPSEPTPGPWRYGGQFGRHRAYVLAGMQTAGEPLGINRVAVVSQDETFVGGDPEANGNLIAAAPDLLAACRAVLAREPLTNLQGRVIGTSGVMLPEALRRQIEAAVARAEGKGVRDAK